MTGRQDLFQVVVRVHDDGAAMAPQDADVVKRLRVSVEDVARDVCGRELDGRPSKALLHLAKLSSKERQVELRGETVKDDVAVVTVSLRRVTAGVLIHKSADAKALLSHGLKFRKRVEALGYAAAVEEALSAGRSSCGFVGCDESCLRVEDDKFAKFQLNRVFLACRPPRVPARKKGEAGLGVFNVLPDEALEMVATKLGPRDLSALSSTCQCMRRTLVDFAPGLRLRLYPHQSAAVWRMLERERWPRPMVPWPLMVQLGDEDAQIVADEASGVVEKDELGLMIQDCAGGLFCDEPGLGKTITAIAVILKTLGQRARPPKSVSYEDLVEETIDGRLVRVCSPRNALSRRRSSEPRRSGETDRSIVHRAPRRKKTGVSSTPRRAPSSKSTSGMSLFTSLRTNGTEAAPQNVSAALPVSRNRVPGGILRKRDLDKSRVARSVRFDLGVKGPGADAPHKTVRPRPSSQQEVGVTASGTCVLRLQLRPPCFDSDGETSAGHERARMRAQEATEGRTARAKIRDIRKKRKRAPEADEDVLAVEDIVLIPVGENSRKRKRKGSASRHRESSGSYMPSTSRSSRDPIVPSLGSSSKVRRLSFNESPELPQLEAPIDFYKVLFGESGGSNVVEPAKSLGSSRRDLVMSDKGSATEEHRGVAVGSSSLKVEIDTAWDEKPGLLNSVRAVDPPCGTARSVCIATKSDRRSDHSVRMSELCRRVTAERQNYPAVIDLTSPPPEASESTMAESLQQVCLKDSIFASVAGSVPVGHGARSSLKNGGASLKSTIEDGFRGSLSAEGAERGNNVGSVAANCTRNGANSDPPRLETSVDQRDACIVGVEGSFEVRSAKGVGGVSNGSGVASRSSITPVSPITASAVDEGSPVASRVPDVEASSSDCSRQFGSSASKEVEGENCGQSSLRTDEPEFSLPHFAPRSGSRSPCRGGKDCVGDVYTSSALPTTAPTGDGGLVASLKAIGALQAASCVVPQSVSDEDMALSGSSSPAEASESIREVDRGLGQAADDVLVDVPSSGSSRSSRPEPSPYDLFAGRSGPMRRLTYTPPPVSRFNAYGSEEADTHRSGTRAKSRLRRTIKRPDYLSPGYGHGSLPSSEMRSLPVYLSGATLILVPPVLVSHWSHQIDMHVEEGKLRVLAVKCSDEIPSAVKMAYDYDVIIMSFKALNKMFGETRNGAVPLLCVRFLRVIMDEGHKLGASRAGLTDFSRVCKSVKADRRWIMTGTPSPTTPNSDVAHVQPLLDFIRDGSYGGEKFWNKKIKDPYEHYETEALDRLHSLFTRLMIRSSKSDLENLPKCIVKNVLLDFSEESAKSYNQLVALARRNLLLADWNKEDHDESLLNKKNASACMEYVGNMRSACCFGGFVDAKIDHTELGETLSLLFVYAGASNDGILSSIRKTDMSPLPPGKTSQQNSEPIVVESPTNSPEAHNRWWSSSQYAPSSQVLSSGKGRSQAARESLGLGDAVPEADPMSVTPAVSGSVSNAAADGDDGPSVASKTGIGNTAALDVAVIPSTEDGSLTLPSMNSLPGSTFNRQFRGVLADIGRKMLEGCDCDACGKSTNLPVLSTCGHLVCITCLERNKYACVVPGCLHEYYHDKDEVPEKLIELQPSISQHGWRPSYLERGSTKVEYILKRLDEIEERIQWENGVWTRKKPKVIIFAQFHMHLLLLQLALKDSDKYKDAFVELFRNENEIDTTVLLHKDESTDAQAARMLQTFVHNPDKHILLLEAVHGSVGLDLSFVEHVFLLEPVWDASLENQVISRAHRLGAKFPVHVERIAMRGSIEENMLRSSSNGRCGVRAGQEDIEVSKRKNLLKNTANVSSSGLPPEVTVVSDGYGIFALSETPAEAPPTEEPSSLVKPPSSVPDGGSRGRSPSKLQAPNSAQRRARANAGHHRRRNKDAPTMHRRGNEPSDGSHRSKSLFAGVDMDVSGS